MLTAHDIMRLLRLGSERTARRWIEAWAQRQADVRLPRVDLRRTGKRGRPRYVVDELSFARWRRGLPAIEAAAAQAA